MKFRISKEVMLWAVIIFGVGLFWLQRSLSANIETGIQVSSLPPFLDMFFHWIHMGMAVLGVIVGIGLFLGREIFRKAAVFLEDIVCFM